MGEQECRREAEKGCQGDYQREREREKERKKERQTETWVPGSELHSRIPLIEVRAGHLRKATVCHAVSAVDSAVDSADRTRHLQPRP